MLSVMHFFSNFRFNSNIHVVIVGAGYAGAAAASALDSCFRVTLIEATDSHNHKIAALRAAVMPGWEKRIRVPLDGLLKNGKVLQSKVAAVETGRVILTDQSILECDYVILAHGKGSVNFPCDYSDDITSSADFEIKSRLMQDTITEAQSVLLVGGGAVGVELAGEIAVHHPGKSVTLVHSRSALLSNIVLPIVPAATAAMHDKLVESGVRVILNARVTNRPVLRGGESYLHTPDLAQYSLSNGSSVGADLYIDCTGTTRRTSNLLPAEHLDEHNFVKVQPDLQVVGMPGVFCVGDANNMHETKLAVFAEQHARVAVQNIHNLHNGRPLTPYLPLSWAVMAVPIGPYKGAGAIGNTVIGDFLVSWLLGRGLFVSKVWARFGLAVPALE